MTQTPIGPKTRRPKPNILNTSVTIVALIILIIAGVYLTRIYKHNGAVEETNDAQVEAYLNPVSARAAGYIQRILFEENQWVRQGDTLIILDDREYRNKVEEAEADVEETAAELIVLAAAISSAETGTTVNKDQIAAAKARLWQQQQDIHRYENLVKEEAATGQEYEQVKARYDVAASEYDAAGNTLRTNYTKIDELRTHRALLIANLRRKRSQLALAHINLSYTVITAPYSGRLGRKTIQEGQQIQTGQPLITIVSENNKWITANFKETQLYALHAGKKVDIELDALPGKVFKGHVESVSPGTGAKFSLLPPDNATGNFVKIVQRIPVKLLFDDTSLSDIRIGMNALVTVKK